MNRDIITSALDAEGKSVYIDKAESSRRYRMERPRTTRTASSIRCFARPGGRRSPISQIKRMPAAAENLPFIVRHARVGCNSSSLN